MDQNGPPHRENGLGVCEIKIREGVDTQVGHAILVNMKTKMIEGRTMVQDSFYVDLNEDTEMWEVVGDFSAKVYSTWCDEQSAKEDARKRNNCH